MTESHDRPRRRGRRGGRNRRRPQQPAAPAIPLADGKCRAHRCGFVTAQNSFFCDVHWLRLPQPLRAPLIAHSGDLTTLQALHAGVEYLCRSEHREDYVRLQKLHERIVLCYQPKLQPATV